MFLNRFCYSYTGKLKQILTMQRPKVELFLTKYINMILSFDYFSSERNSSNIFNQTFLKNRIQLRLNVYCHHTYNCIKLTFRNNYFILTIF